LTERREEDDWESLRGLGFTDEDIKASKKYVKRMSLENDEGYIWRRRMTLVKVKIPEGCVKCPDCDGRGEVRIIWGPPNMPGQFGVCITCAGKGYVEIELLEKMKALREKYEKMKKKEGEKK